MVKKSIELKNVPFPVKLTNIEKFEKRSKISVSVYSYDENFSVYVLYHTKERQSKHVNLLLLKNENQTHYCWIKDLSRLISSQLSKHNGKRYPCDRCLRIFYCQENI